MITHISEMRAKLPAMIPERSRNKELIVILLERPGSREESSSPAKRLQPPVTKLSPSRTLLRKIGFS